MTKSYSLQLVVVGSANNIIQVPLFGKHHMSLNALWFREASGTVDALIQLKSPQFRLRYPSGASFTAGGVISSALSSQAYPVFTTTAAHQIGGLNGSIDWDADLQGTIELQMVSIDGSPIAAADYCVLNINCTPIDV